MPKLPWSPAPSVGEPFLWVVDVPPAYLVVEKNGPADFDYGHRKRLGKERTLEAAQDAAERWLEDRACELLALLRMG